MRVAIIGSRGYPYVYSGYETFVKELSERLVHKGIDVTVYCHKNLFKSYPPNVNGIKLIYKNSIQKKSLSQIIHSAQSFADACLSNYDIILAVNSSNGPFGLLTRIAGKRTAINVDGLEWLRPKWKGLGGKYFYFASRLATVLFNRVITDSVEMHKIYKLQFKSDSTVIAYGANKRYSKNSSLIDRWGLTKDDYFLIVGRLIPDNNSHIIIGEFIQSPSNKKLVIVGDVPYSNDKYALKIKNFKDERIIFTGYVNDQDQLAELYHNCFIYFHGHEYGGTNPTLLKALAYGCAILAIDTVFSKEVLENGKFGLLFSKKAGDLQKRIEFVENNPQKIKNLRAKSRKRVEYNYTWEKITEQYINLFQEMLGRKW